MAIALRVVVHRVDDDLPRDGVGRNVPIVLERNRDDDEVAESSGIRDAGSLRTLAQFGDQVLKRLRSAGIGDRDVVPGPGQVRGERRADVAGADDPDLHRTK